MQQRSFNQTIDKDRLSRRKPDALRPTRNGEDKGHAFREVTSWLIGCFVSAI